MVVETLPLDGLLLFAPLLVHPNGKNLPAEEILNLLVIDPEHGSAIDNAMHTERDISDMLRLVSIAQQDCPARSMVRNHLKRRGQALRCRPLPPLISSRCQRRNQQKRSRRRLLAVKSKKHKRRMACRRTCGANHFGNALT